MDVPRSQRRKQAAAPTRPRWRTACAAVCGTLAVALSVPLAAPAHDGLRTTSTRFVSIVTGIVPAVPGLDVSVADRLDRLVLTNGTGKTVLVRGYQQEPYLRFDTRGVWVNRHSPARWLNLKRYPDEHDVPEGTDPTLPAAWTLMATGSTWEWHDQRINWGSDRAPDQAGKPRNGRIEVVAWVIPIAVDGTPGLIHGRLDYLTGGQGLGDWLIVAIALPVGAVLAALGGWLLLRRRRRAPLSG